MRNFTISAVICALVIFGLPAAISSVLMAGLGGWQLGETVQWLVNKYLGDSNG
jgi:uncharacterized membrane protein YccF (DUF307 family)